MLKYKKKCPPPRRGRDRVGVKMGFFHSFFGKEGNPSLLWQREGRRDFILIPNRE
jgi:hypothetical protein